MSGAVISPILGAMDILNMLGELRQERDRLEEAIIVVERLAAHGGKRRGRPPKWMQEVKSEVVGGKRRGRPPGSKNKPKVD